MWSPVAEVAPNARSIAPTLESYNLEVGTLEEHAKSVRREAPEVAGLLVDADKEWRADQHVAPWTTKLPERPDRPPWINDVLQHLLADDEVEGLRRDRRAKVETGKSKASIRHPGTITMEIATDLDSRTPLGRKGVDERSEVSVHHHAAPLSVGERLKGIDSTDGTT